MPPRPPIPDGPPPAAILGKPPIPPKPPRPPRPPIPPKPAPAPAPKPAFAYVYEVDDVEVSVVADAVAPEDALAEALLPLTKCTVTPSSILYSSNVVSSFKIFPICSIT